MKNVKWTANELLDTLNRETNVEEIKELYKALIAYGCGLDKITEEIDNILEDVVELDYYANDYIRGFVNDDIMDAANERLVDYL
jgi:hypothetical protein